jgi:hypothetical protein
MPIEALFWSLLLILSPALGSRLWPALRERFDHLPFDIKAWAAWIHSLGLPYMAIILGSVSGRKMGLYGQAAGEWFVGLLACGLGLGAAILLLNHQDQRPDPEVDLASNIQEETRWAFYRGAATLWLPGMLSPLLGFALAVLELGTTHVQTSGRQPPSPSQWKTVLRAAFSTLLFLATGSFWITAGTQLTIATILNKRSREDRLD